jgi:hypothetical protein
MAEFTDRDTSGSVTIDQTVTVEEIHFKRYRGYAGAPLEISVTKIVNGVTVIARVPQAQVDAVWPGTAKTLKAWLLTIIDAAV